MDYLPGMVGVHSLPGVVVVIQESIPAVDDFLVRHLEMWNGVKHRHLILSLLSCLRVQPFAGQTLLKLY